MKEGMFEITERWEKDSSGIGTLIERYYFNTKGNKVIIPTPYPVQVQFVTFPRDINLAPPHSEGD